MDDEILINRFDALFEIWVSPQRTIRSLINRGNQNRFLEFSLLLLPAGFGGVISQAINWHWGDVLPVWSILIIACLLSPIMAIIQFFLGSLIFRSVGKLFGGQASWFEMWVLMAWSSVPAIPAQMFSLFFVLVFGDKLFKSDFGEYILRSGNTNGYFFVLGGLLLIALVIGIWGLVIFVAGLSEVHRFSIWKGTATACLPTVLIWCVICAATLAVVSIVIKTIMDPNLMGTF